MRLRGWLLAALLLSMTACGNPCDRLAKKVCKLKGDKSKPCIEAKKQQKSAGSQEARMKCRAGLDLIKIMEEKKKKNQ